MNTADFQQTGGLPLETNTLDFMQSAYSIFNAFGALAGDKTIVSGCEIQGVNVTDGYIFYNNELLFFKGGIKQNTIVIIEQKQEVEFEDKTLKDVYKTRYATFGVSGNSIPWGDFKRYYINQPMYKEIKWVGADVKQEDLQRGWFFADGKNGTDNISGRGVMGLDPKQPEFNSVGKTGGEKEHQLTINEMPRHSLSMRLMTGASFDSSTKQYAGSGSRTANTTLTNQLEIVRTDSIGRNVAHNILSPYVVAKAIQFIG